MKYVTLEELKRELPFDAADYRIDDTTEDAAGHTDWDNVLERAIDTAERLLEDWLETTFQVTTVTESLSRPDHVDSIDLPLPDLPIDAVASVETEDDGVLTEGTDYHVLETHLRIEEDSTTIQSWPTGFQEITVTWDYGFDGAPEPVREGIIRVARDAVEQIATDGLERESTGDGASYTYRPPQHVKAEVLAMTREYQAPSYYSGSMVI